MVSLSSAIKLVRNNFILFTIILVGLLLRFVIVYPGYYSHGDELMHSQAVYMITHKTLSMQTQWLGYPPLIGWIMALAFAFVFIPWAWCLTLFRHFAEILTFLLPTFLGILITVLLLRKVGHWGNKKTIVIFFLILVGSLILSGLFAISQTNLFHREVLGKYGINALYWGRYVTATFGAGVIYLTYKVALNFFENRMAGFIAALLVAVNYRLVLSSHIGFIDMYNVFFLLAVFLSISSLLKAPSWRKYLIVWILASLSFLTKYQVYAFFPLFLAHLIISLRYSDRSFKRFLAQFFSKEVIFGGVVCLGIILIAHIHYFQYWEIILDAQKYEAKKYAFGSNVINIFPASYMYHVGVGALLSWFAIFGILAGLIRRNSRPATFILLSVFPIIIFLYMYYTGSGIYTRNTIVLIPILLIFSAFFIDCIFNVVFKRGKLLGAFFLIVVLFFGLKDHLINDKILVEGYTKKSAFLEAGQWTEKNIKGEVTLATYEHNPSSKNKLVQIKSLPYLDKVFSYKELKEEGYDYAVLDMIDIQGAFLWWMGQSPEIGIKFWNKPNDLLSQNYIALALREILWSHSPKAFLSPWQASGHNFVVVKIDKDKNREFLPITKYNFEDNKWIPLSYLPGDKENLRVNWEGRYSNKALVIKSRGLLPGSVRWQSPYFEVKPDYGYKAVGWIKNTSQLTKEVRDGFLRLDFYSQEVPASITSRPIVSFVTGRIYGESAWHRVEVDGVAPKDARFAVIGFQTNSQLTPFYLDSVEVFQTPGKMPASEFTPILIPDDDLFLPNNRGIL